LQLSQSKSEDNWLQNVLDDSTSETFKLTKEEAREIKILKRKGFKDFAEAYYEYLQLEKQKGPLDCSLKEFCETKSVNIGFRNDRVFAGSQQLF
jgi:hypothetical protein